MTVRDAAAGASQTGTSWDVLEQAHLCVQCDADDGAPVDPGEPYDVGAQRRPNTGANQRGRASMSSSAGSGGAPRRVPTVNRIEALLDSDDRPRYPAMGTDPTADGLPAPPTRRCARDSRLARRRSAQEQSTRLRSEAHEQPRPPTRQSRPRPDKLTIWPVDDGRYGLDATFQGASGYQRAEPHQRELEQRGITHGFRQEPDGGWTLRFGPFRDRRGRSIRVRLLNRPKQGECGEHRICHRRFVRRGRRVRRPEHTHPNSSTLTAAISWI
jgi:hypothetical protein